MMMIKKIAAAAALVTMSVPVFATIASGVSGNGELVLVVWDSVAKVSYTKDLGVTQDSFLALATNNEAGYSTSWGLGGDTYWGQFASASSTASNRSWTVFAIDTTGGYVAGGVRLLSTVKVGDESKVATTTNQNFSNGISNTQAELFFDSVNSTGSHLPATGADVSFNGSSFNTASDGNAYFGAVPIGPQFNGKMADSSINDVGVASVFDYVSRSGPIQGKKVVVSTFGNSLYTGSMLFSTAAADPTLSYNLQAVAVPEPSTVVMLAAGLMAVGFVARRRRG